MFLQYKLFLEADVLSDHGKEVFVLFTLGIFNDDGCGIHFVHVGTTSPEYAREIKRHSRVVDIEPERIIIRTFDHDRRKLDESLEVTIPKKLDELLAARKTKA